MATRGVSAAVPGRGRKRGVFLATGYASYMTGEALSVSSQHA
ncbi:hypothetical protein [Streptomyces sp. NPDC001292]